MVTVTAANAPADFVGINIILVGPFDPMILQPANLVSNGLLERTDLDDLRYDILAPEISVLKLPWMQVIVEPSKLTATTTLESPIGEPVRDFVVALHEIRPIKTLTALGLNHDVHYGVSSEDVWHKIGHTLAPKQHLWDKILNKPGMLALAVRGTRDDEWGGNVNVRVEPSLRIRPGIYVSLNDHFGLKSETSPDKGQLIEVLDEDWASSRALFDRVVNAVKELGS